MFDDWTRAELRSLVKIVLSRVFLMLMKQNLFFYLLQDQIYTVKIKSCNSEKVSKERQIVLQYCNVDGCEKLIPLVIDRSKKPRSFKNIKLFSTS